MRSEDGSIIRRCLDGDSASFGLLVDKYKASIYALAYSRLRNFHDAEDVTQEAFLKAYRDLRRLKQWDSFLFWLRSITINLCKNIIRARSRRPDKEFIEDQESENLEANLIETHNNEPPFISSDEAIDILNKALESLPDTYREVITLRYLGDMSGEQISQFLGISHSSVRQRLTRARRQLKAEMLPMMSSVYEQQRLRTGRTFVKMMATGYFLGHSSFTKELRQKTVSRAAFGGDSSGPFIYYLKLMSSNSGGFIETIKFLFTFSKTEENRWYLSEIIKVLNRHWYFHSRNPMNYNKIYSFYFSPNKEENMTGS